MAALSYEEADKLASKVRSTYWQDGGFPVDPITVSRAMGLRVVDAELPEDVAGALLKKVGQDPIIMLHGDDSPSRKRFTCSHELGHYVYRLERGHFDDQEIDHVDYRNEVSANGSDPEEVSANRFAAAFLMPEVKVREMADKKDANVYALARFFGVSPTAMSVRLDTMGVDL